MGSRGRASVLIRGGLLFEVEEVGRVSCDRLDVAHESAVEKCQTELVVLRCDCHSIGDVPVDNLQGVVCYFRFFRSSL